MRQQGLAVNNARIRGGGVCSLEQNYFIGAGLFEAESFIFIMNFMLATIARTNNYSA